MNLLLVKDSESSTDFLDLLEFAGVIVLFQVTTQTGRSVPTEPLQDDAQADHEDEDEKDEESDVECRDFGTGREEQGRWGTVAEMP